MQCPSNGERFSRIALSPALGSCSPLSVLLVRQGPSSQLHSVAGDKQAQNQTRSRSTAGTPCSLAKSNQPSPGIWSSWQPAAVSSSRESHPGSLSSFWLESESARESSTGIPGKRHQCRGTVDRNSQFWDHILCCTLASRRSKRGGVLSTAAARSESRKSTLGFYPMAQASQATTTTAVSQSASEPHTCSMRTSASACCQNTSAREELLRGDELSETPAQGLAFEPLADRKARPSSRSSQPSSAAACLQGNSPESSNSRGRESACHTQERPPTGGTEETPSQLDNSKEALPESVDPSRLPRHVAMILDGNSRWAERRGLPKEMGHEAGVQALKRAVRLTGTWGIKALTVFAFSTENWKRPKLEVEFLMALLERLMDDDIGELHREGVVVRVIGDLTMLPGNLQRKIEQTRVLTQHNTGLKLTIAVNYSGRQDIVHACRNLAARVASGEMQVEEITDQVFESGLETAWLGPALSNPDLLIRTSGEQRMSNFLLWQTAYTELVFSPCLWPDFGVKEYVECLREYQGRDRRFGGRNGTRDGNGPLHN